MSMEDKRFRRRTWNRTKSAQHLPKYTSQPELQLLPQGRPRFQCQQCGFINTLFPLCLCCSWTSQAEAEHEFDPTLPRARRASAPASFLKVKVRIEEEKDTTDPHDQRRRRRLIVSKSTGCFPLSAGIREEEETMVTSKQPLSNGGQNGDALSSAIASSEPVATATHSLSSLVFARAQTTSQAGEVPASSLTIERDLSDLLPQSLPSEEQPTSSVDRPTPIMPAIRSSRNLRVKRSHQLLLIDIHDTNMLPSTSSDDDDLILNNSLNQDCRKPSFLDQHQHQRTIRRRKHLNIMQTSVAKSGATEPIAIALNIHTPSSFTDLDSEPTEPSHRLSTGVLNPQSATSESSNGDPTTPPLTPPLLPPPPPSTDPNGLSTHSPGSSPVRLGHPSRPYYSAIRKNGISPPPSRPSSISGPSPSSSPRPQSYTPPSSFPTSAANSTTASRHLSMSAMFVSPPYSSPPGVFSAFSVMDDADNEDEDDVNMPVLPPTPAPGRTRFSLSSSDRRFSHGPLLSTPTSATPKHNHSQSLSQARSKGLRGSVGFSMSGETELRMALAIGAADSGVAESGFRFRETVVSPPTSVDTEAQPRATRNSFMDRVKKLRQGLKDLLFMTSTTSTTTTTA